MQYALAKIPTPLLSTPHFAQVFGGEDGATLAFDEQGLLRPVEMVALPGTKFTLVAQHGENIWKVRTKEYPQHELYADLRFLEMSIKSVPERIRKTPDQKTILRTLRSLEGAAYVWGGNWLGIPEILTYYPPRRKISAPLRKHWTLNGVDCSGLLYLATEGTTPRNTSELVYFGKSLPIEGKSAKEIQALIEPLDLIVWKGHVLIALDKETLIESRADKMRVMTTPLSVRLSEIISSMKRLPVNNWDATESYGPRFVINRWI